MRASDCPTAAVPTMESLWIVCLAGVFDGKSLTPSDTCAFARVGAPRVNESLFRLQLPCLPVASDPSFGRRGCRTEPAGGQGYAGAKHGEGNRGADAE